MQPPGGSGTPHSVTIGPHHLGTHMGAHTSQLSPMGRRHGCSSAFSAPPGSYAPGHHHPPPLTTNEPGYIHGKLSFLYILHLLVSFIFLKILII